MTRAAEQAAERVRKAKKKLEDAKRDAHVALAQEREVTRQANNKRRYHVGALADEAGLFGWSNAELFALFTVLGELKQCPNPAAVLERFLGEASEFLAEKLYIAPSTVSPMGREETYARSTL